MSELQIGLLAIGGLVVAGVLVYNRVQERSASREADQAFRSQHADALLETPLAVRAGTEPRSSHRPSPALAAAPDPAIDYIVEFTSSQAGGQTTVQEEWPAIERRHARRALIAAGTDGKSWHAGLQLVSRDGAVGEADLIEFRSAIETIAARIGATVSASEMRAAMDKARALDEFCGETDIQLVVHVQGGPFPGSRIRSVAEAGGMALEADGKLALRNDDQLLLYTLAARDGAPFSAATINDASPLALSFVLEVARVPETRRSFESMARLAHQLAATLGGSIVDDNGNLLDDQAVAAVALQLDEVRARLEAQGVAPGSPAALRLFS